MPDEVEKSMERTPVSNMGFDDCDPRNDSPDHSDTNEWRKRIERKIDRLSDALTQIVRLDERIVTLFNNQSSQDGRLEALERRLQAIELTSATRSPFFAKMDTAVVALITGGVGIFIGFMVNAMGG